MKAAELIQLGEAAFGPGWKAPLARALGYRRETMWRYASGRSDIPLEIAVVIKAVCRKRITGEAVRFKKLQERMGAF